MKIQCESRLKREFETSTYIFVKALRLNKSPFESMNIGKRKSAGLSSKLSSQQILRRENGEGVACEEIEDSGEGRLLESKRRKYFVQA